MTESCQTLEVSKRETAFLETDKQDNGRSLPRRRMTDRLHDVLSKNAGSGSEIAQAAVRWMTMLLPETCSVIVLLDELSTRADVIAGDMALQMARNVTFTAGADSVLRTALTDSRVSHAALTAELRRQFPWGADLEDSQSTLSVQAMPQISPSAVVAVFHEPEGAHVVAAALSSLSVLLAKPGDAPAPNATVYDVISKAKREWERTVDTLDHLVFLLDRKGDVLRANRAIERWGLCDVGEVRGLSIHSVLHPSCDEPSCRLERLLTCRWKQVRSRGPTSFEIFDEQLNMAMQLTLQPISEPDSDTEPSDSSYGIVVVEDVTESHQTQTKLRQLNDELSVRVRDRTKQLQAMNRDLAEQISKREIAEQQVQASRDELQRLSARLLKTQEAERRRIALELHDSVGQSLGALKYSLERYIALSGNPELGNAEQALDSAVKQLQTAIEDTRSIAMSLRPSLLDDMGAVSAIRWLCRRFAETYVDIHVIADCNLGDQDVPERLVTTVFRIVQEALSNVAKHSQARSVMVALRRYTRTLALEVRDDGVGFDTRSCDLPSGQCLGIVGMRERAALTGGKFALISGPSVSTRVRVEWEVSD